MGMQSQPDCQPKRRLSSRLSNQNVRSGPQSGPRARFILADCCLTIEPRLDSCCLSGNSVEVFQQAAEASLALDVGEHLSAAGKIYGCRKRSGQQLGRVRRRHSRCLHGVNDQSRYFQCIDHGRRVTGHCGCRARTLLDEPGRIWHPDRRLRFLSTKPLLADLLIAIQLCCRTTASERVGTHTG